MRRRGRALLAAALIAAPLAACTPYHGGYAGYGENWHGGDFCCGYPGIGWYGGGYWHDHDSDHHLGWWHHNFAWHGVGPAGGAGFHHGFAEAAPPAAGFHGGFAGHAGGFR